jgi:long-subunit acyl-CoA synthetase (AMP-forming)
MSIIEPHSEVTKIVTYFQTRPENIRPLELDEATKHILSETLYSALEKASRKQADKPALWVERPIPNPEVTTGNWKTWSWKQYFQTSKRFANALIQECNLQKYDGVVIYGFNSPEWLISFVGATFAQAIPAGIYPTDSLETIVYKTRHLGAKAAIVQNQTQALKFASKVEDLRKLTHIIVWEQQHNDPDETLEILARKDGSRVRIISWDTFVDLGSADKAVPATQSKPNECACVVFTSGTTGLPKAVMLTHDNLNYEARSVRTMIPNFGTGDESVLSFLPLSHVGGLMMDIAAPIFAAADVEGGSNVYFARPYDLKTGTLVNRMRQSKPTVFLAVPLVYERMMEKLQAMVQQQSPAKRALLLLAQRQALIAQRNCQLGGSGESPWFYRVSEMILQKLKEGLGLERCKFAYTAAAPISKKTLEFFASLSLPVHEAYGSSETTGVCTITTPDKHIWGSIGHPLAGCDVRILNSDGQQIPQTKNLFKPLESEQGEICCRGRNIMLGYMMSRAGDVDDEAIVKKKNLETLTMSVSDNQPFCRSGDKGCWDERRMFRFTGRFKEQIKGLGGEIVAPVPLEDYIKMKAPAISKVIVVGDNRPFNVALFTLQQEEANGENPGNGVLVGLAKTISPNSSTTEQACSDPIWHHYLQHAIEKMNSDGAVCPNKAHQVKRFTILGRDFSLVAEEYTPTLKFKRMVIESHNIRAIQRLYNDNNEREDQVRYVRTFDAINSKL